MKIDRVRSQVVRLPQEEPLAGGKSVPGATRDFVVVKVATSDGIEGIGLTFFGGPLTNVLKATIDEFGELIRGKDPLAVEAVAETLRAAASSAGPAGIFTLALSPIDTALWDIRGKAFNLPSPSSWAAPATAFPLTRAAP